MPCLRWNIKYIVNVIVTYHIMTMTCMSMCISVQQHLNHIFFYFLFLAPRVVKKGTATVTTLTTLKLSILTTFWPPSVLCALRFQNYKGKTINHSGRGCRVSRFWEEKKQVPCCRRKKKQVPCCRGKKGKCLVTLVGMSAPQKRMVLPTGRKILMRRREAEEKKNKCLFAEEKKVSGKSVPDTPPPHND